MKLNEIELINYRNISHMDVKPCPGINVIYGDNAQGKTNLIEAIWLFTGNSSFRGAKTGELIRFDQTDTRLSVSFSDREREQKASIQLNGASKKKILLNGMVCKTAADLNGSFYSVVFSPAHLSFIKDGPKNRRKFIDIAISQIKPQYKNYLCQYEKLVDQRNALLKNASQYRDLEQNMEIWDRQMAKTGTIISIYRGDYVKKLQIIAKTVYEGLSAQRETFEIGYLSTVFENLPEVTAYEDRWVELYYQKLRESFPTDLRQGFTSVGIHRDDLEVFIDGKSARTYGSQGQQRSSVITLKLAEASLLKKVTGEDPVMLLDDVMSELDESRQDYILNHLKNMQVFITCCDVSNAARLQSGKIFRIEAGSLAEETQLS